MSKYVQLKLSLSPLTITTLYVLTGALWILYSDRLLEGLTLDVETLSRLQTVKGWFFIGVTAYLLYFLMQRAWVDLQRSHQALQKSEARFRRLVDANIIGIIFWDVNGKVLEANDAFLNMVGYTRPEVLSGQLHWPEITPTEYQSLDQQALVELSKTGIHRPFEKEYFTKDGSRIPILVGGAFLEKVQDQGVSFVLDLRDRKRAEAKVLQLNATLEQRVLERTAELEAANRELNAFSYSVSHDLRAPLRHISGFVTALEQRLKELEVTDSKGTHYLEVIQASSQKMAQLIDGLLTLSRVGRRELDQSLVPLNPLVDRAIALEKNQLTVTGDRTVEFTVGQLPTVIGDAALLQQVFSNLINNAVKFTRECESAQIVIDVLTDGTIFIQDNGVGFQQEYADQLFGAFQRLHSQKQFEGLGIGLAIVQRIIHRHGGNIWAESQVHQGARFLFRLKSIKSDTLETN